MRPPQIFDPHARRLRRDRIAACAPGLFETLLAERMIERIAHWPVDGRRVLLIGANRPLAAALLARDARLTVVDPSPRLALALGGRAMEEDALDLGDASFDLTLSAGTLDTVNDLPGALLLARRTLVPGERFVANVFGHPSLERLRAATQGADSQHGIAVQRVHPQIDARAGGELLQRAGFERCVSDSESVSIAYSSLARLLDDLRDGAMTNLLARRVAVGRHWLAAAEAAFGAHPERKTIETMTIVTLTGGDASARFD